MMDILAGQIRALAKSGALIAGLGLAFSLATVACGSSTRKGDAGGQDGSGEGDAAVDAGDGSTVLGGCIDKVGGSNTSPAIVNQPDRICDTYGTFTLTASAAGALAATNVTLFRTDSTGLNLAASGGHFNRGVWTTQAGAQNIPGNYVVHLFIATTSNPAPADFVALASPLSLTLAAGDNTFHFFADGDDKAGGDYGFGLNVWLGTAAGPTLSGFTAVPGGTVMVDGTNGCSPAYDGSCGVSANTLATTSTPTVTLTSFTVDGVGGAAAP